MKGHARLLDLQLAIPMLLLATMGVLTIYSAGRGTSQANLYVKQLVWIAGGIAGMLYLGGTDHRRLFRNSLPVYGFGLLTLAIVLVAGKTVAGSRSWFQVGGFSLQPSEFMKWATLLFVAHRLGNKPPELLEPLEFDGAAGLVSYPMLLVLLQPDLGVALTYLPIFILIPLIRGVKWRWIAVGLAIGVAGAAVTWNFKLKAYQKERILTFLDPARDLRGKGYQVHQSRIAIGAGGLTGQGFTSGSQTQLNFLPVKTTDFVFSVWAEERGFLGVLGVLALFGVLLKRILDAALAAKEYAGAYFCAGAAAIYGAHILVNTGMVVGIVPTTGIPLPFFTYGGSSTLAFFLAMGVILNILHHAKVR